jgi:hypothetical protein
MKRLLIFGLATLVACNDTNVPYYTAPTSVSNTPSGVQNAVSGLVSGTRGSDLFWYLADQTGYARDGANYTNTEPRFILLILGLQSPSDAWSQVWSQFYPVILQAHQIVATVPTVQPAYSASEAAALVGVVQTVEALTYMMIAEDHDTSGIAIMPQAPTTAAPGYCIQDGWRYIVALLDSANAQLMAAGSTPLPVKLPDGYKAVAATGATFSAFNRALAGKAGLELAYAIARRSPATAPGPNATGQPDQTALARADSAIKASALYAPASLAPPTAGGFAPDGYSVLYNFSATSGDITNPFNNNVGTFIVLNTIPSSQDTAHDLRWRNKFIRNPNPVQQSAYASAASPYIYGMYPSPGSYLPIVRNEELNLVEAEIQIGLGHYATAASIIDNVRLSVGGSGLKSGFQADTIVQSATDTLFVPAVDPSSYTSVRDFLLREQQISTAFEGSADRMIAIRNYGVATQVDTTWGTKDLHTVVDPIPFAEISSRGGSFPRTCSQ